MKRYSYIWLACSLLLAACGSQKKLAERTATTALSPVLPQKVLHEAVKDSLSPTVWQGLTEAELRPLFFPDAPKRETRAVWLTTIGGLDWPRTKANTPERRLRQQAELCAILDKLKAAGINTVILQTRVRGTVIYPSALEPWEIALTGQYNGNPGYDPLRFAIEECHKRGMELHAWMVAIPVGKVSAQKAYGAQSLTRKRKNLVVRDGDEWFMNPGNPSTPAYLASLAAEITKNYDIDGLNLDYIRYPEAPHSLKDKADWRKYGKGLSLSDWRRKNITACVEAIYKAVKAVKPWVKVSSSPVGKYQDLTRYPSYGWNSRNTVYQEAEEWLKKGIHDELFPMMYFDGKHFYPFAADWQENAEGRPIVPGLGIYFLDKSLKDWPLDVVRRQISVTRQLGMGGQAYFRSRFLTDNLKDIYTYVKTRLYPTPAMPQAMTWTNTPECAEPASVSVSCGEKGATALRWNRPASSTNGDTYRYNVYAGDSPHMDISQAKNLLSALQDSTLYVDTMRYAGYTHRYYAVTAVNRYGKESRPVVVSPQGMQEFRVKDNTLYTDTPLAGEVEWLVVSDAYGQQIARFKPTVKGIDLSSLPDGYYKVSAVYKEKTKKVGYFLK